MKKQLGILRSIAIYYWKPFNKRRLMRFYSQFIKKGDLCFDIGAHLGNRINAWSALGATVVGAEPQPACWNFLKDKFGNKQHITLINKAVGEKEGKAELHISELTPTVSTLADVSWRNALDEKTSFKVHWNKTQEVAVTTLDKLIEQYGMPKFCKIDVEDYEVFVLKGLSVPLPALSFEYYTPTLYRAFECIDVLESLGTYEYNWSFGESQKFNTKKWISAEEMKSIFETYSENDRSGDVYAKLKKSL